MFLSLIFVFLLAGADVIYAESSPSWNLTWQECAKTALEHNPSIRASLHSSSALKFNVDKSRASHYPDLRLSGSLRHSTDDIESLDPTTRNESYSAKASVEVFSGFKSQTNVKKAKAEYSRSVYQDQSTHLNTMSSLRKAYVRLAFAQQNTRLSKQIVDRSLKSKNFLEQRFKGGQDAKWSYEKAEVAYEEALMELSKAQDDVVILEHTLLDLMGTSMMRSKGSIVISESFDTATPDASLNEMIKDVETHPEIMAQKNNTSISQLSVQLEKSNFYPTVSVFGGFDSSQTNSDSSRDNWSIGTEVSLPIFSGFGTVASVKSAQESYLQQTDILQKTIADKKTAIRQAYYQYKKSKDTLRILSKTLEVAEHRALTIQREYEIGLKEYLDWDQSQSMLTSSERSLLNAKEAAIISFIELNTTAGKDIFR